MKTTITQQALLVCCILSCLTTPSAFSSTADFLQALNGLELASNTIQAIPGASATMTTKAQGITSLIANNVCTIAADPTIASSDFAAINSFLNTQISTQPSLTSTVATVQATIPPALFKQAQIFYSIVNNANLTTQSDRNAAGINAVALVNTLDQLWGQWKVAADGTPTAISATHTALTNYATGSTGAWIYTTNTATNAWLQTMATKITAYVAVLANKKSLRTFSLSGTLQGITSLNGNLWLVNGNAISKATQTVAGGNISISTSNTAIPTPSSGTHPLLSDGTNLWFIEQDTKKIGKVTVSSTPNTISELSLGTQLTLVATATGALSLEDASNTVLKRVNGGWFTPASGGTTSLTFSNPHDQNNWQAHYSLPGYLSYYHISNDLVTITAAANGNLSFSDSKGSTIPAIAGGTGTATFNIAGTFSYGTYSCQETITIDATAAIIKFYIALGSVAIPSSGGSASFTLANPMTFPSPFTPYFYNAVALNTIIVTNNSGSLSMQDQYPAWNVAGSHWETATINVGSAIATTAGSSTSFYDITNTGNQITLISDGTKIHARIMLGTATKPNTPGAAGSTSTTLSLPGSLSDTIALSADATGVITVTDTFGTSIGIIPAGGSSITFTAFDSSPTSNLLIGPDARLWFGALASSTNQAVLKAITTTTNAITEYVVGSSVGFITSITTSPDHASLWLVTNTGMLVNVTTNGTVAAPIALSAGANSIIVGPDNNLWIGLTNNSIVVVSTNGTILKTYATTAAPQQLIKDTNNTVWFTENGYIGKITAQGYLAEIPTSTTSQVYLTQGPDGNVWFTAGTSLCKLTT